METGKGSIDCPWLLQAQAGQRVNLTLVNFDTLSSSHPSVCHVYAVIREIGVSQTICRGRTRLAHVYTSTTHAVYVRIVGSNSVNDDHGFSLLKYESTLYCILEVGLSEWKNNSRCVLRVYGLDSNVLYIAA